MPDLTQSEASADRDRLRERLVQLTRDLVLIESTDSRPEERRRCFQLVRNHLEEIPGIVLRKLESRGYESLLVLPEGCSRAEVLFCGHLDVVEHPDPDSYRSRVESGRIIGPGAGDMKGQLAILLELVRHLWNRYPGLPVGLAISSDEERGGQDGVRHIVEDTGICCGVAVIPDGGSLTDLTVEEKGIIHLKLRATGRSAHAARPWLGVNALERLLEAVARVQRTVFDPYWPERIDPDDPATHWFPTCATTAVVTANDSPNRIPEEAEAVLDIRFPPPHTVESILAEIGSCLEPGLEMNPMVCAEPTHLAPDPRFLALTTEVTGEPVRLVRACGGSDARFFCRRQIPVMLSRPRVGSLHARDEWIEIDSMLAYFEICRRYALERCAIFS